MGKINATSSEVDIEVIPVESTLSSKKSQSQSVFENPIRMMHRVPYMSDPTIVPRVQKYLEANVHKHYIDINSMADELQKTYREYAKRKRTAFRGAVKKAYSIVMKNYSMSGQGQTSSEEDISDESAEGEVHFEQGRVDNAMMGMFGYAQKVTNIQQGELIDISSDEEAPPTPSLTITKAKNGPSTSQRLQNKHPLLPTPGAVSKSPSIEQDKGVTLTNRSEQPDRAKKRKLEISSGPLLVKKKKYLTAEKPVINFENVAGMDHILDRISKLLMPFRNPGIFSQNGIESSQGILLHGPPGCGKTLLVNAIAGQFGFPLWKVSAPELVSGVSGGSEERIRELFETAMSTTPSIIFIDEIDTITQNRETASKDMERRIVSQLISCMDELSKTENGQQVLVIGATNRPSYIDPALRRAGRFQNEICVGIPNVRARLEILKSLSTKCKLSDDVNLEILAKNIPGYVGADIKALIQEAVIIASSRLYNEIIELHKLEEAISHRTRLDKQKAQAEKDEASNDADKSDPEIIVDGDSKDKTELKDAEEQSTTNDSAVVVIDDDIKPVSDKSEPQTSSNGKEHKNIVENKLQDMLPEKTPLEELIEFNSIVLSSEQIDNMSVTMEDFQEAMKHVQPSAKREGFATVPDVTWDNVGSLADIREELQTDILGPVMYPAQYKSAGITAPAGILLCGPPGCGKTLVAKAIANEAGINFISVNGPELLNMYVGESERAVRTCFERARNSAPCVIFFDELDALCPKRSDSADGGVSGRVVNQLLTEMDGVKGREGVYLLAASNRPDIIDPAILRPGRFDKIIYVGLPTSDDRVEILRTLTKNGQEPLLAPDVDLEVIGKSEECQGYTGADLSALVKQTATEAIKDMIKEGDKNKPFLVTTEHFKRAVAKIKPSVSEKDLKKYEKLKKLYSITKEDDVEEMEYS